jgi:hypothetical protein
MLTYETISDALLDSAEQVGLNVWQSDEHLDPQTLTRTITLKCLPQGEATPRASSLQASIAFKWDAAMTAISTMGTEALCEKYHGDNVACSHSLIGCGYEATLTLEIAYTLPLNMNVNDDLGTLQRIARGIQDVHRSMIDHKNVVVMDAGLSLDGGMTRVTQLVAKQRWTIGDPIHELEAIEDVLEEACSEVRDMLLALVERFTGNSLVDVDDQPLIAMPPDLNDDDDRIYLRPPTA